MYLKKSQSTDIQAVQTVSGQRPGSPMKRIDDALCGNHSSVKCSVICSLTVVDLYVCVSHLGPPTHPHVVKTASIGTLGRTRTPMIVTVPNAPDVPETSKMLEDVDSVSTAPHTGCL